MKRKIDPTREVFAVYLGTPLDQVGEGSLPDWLQQLDDDGLFGRIVNEFGLPAQARDELVAIVLTTDQCLSVPAKALAQSTQKELRSIEAQVVRLKASLLELERREPPCLRAEMLNERRMPDGKIAIDPAPGVMARVRQALDELPGALADISTRSGRRTSCMRWANVALDAAINRLSPSMSAARRAALADELFADVRRRHGQRSRAQYRDADEVPRSRDMVRRVAARPGSAVRKTRPKSD